MHIGFTFTTRRSLAHQLAILKMLTIKQVKLCGKSDGRLTQDFCSPRTDWAFLSLYTFDAV
jgi:hypothetical protein